MKHLFTFILIAILLSCTSNSSTETTQESSTEIEELEFSYEYEKTWDEFRFSFLQNNPDFDWMKHGIENNTMQSELADDFEDEYTKQTLAETTFDLLEDGTFEGKKTKVMHVVIASSDMLMGYSYHFIISGFSQVELVGKTPFEAN